MSRTCSKTAKNEHQLRLCMSDGRCRLARITGILNQRGNTLSIQFLKRTANAGCNSIRRGECR
ncbi:MAG: hypothetical protein GY803_17670 [Chloroflexi bacterium]|nr:hypothetical protein [Chloroflexota bacterium]